MEQTLVDRLKKRSTKSKEFMDGAVPIEAGLIIREDGSVIVASILWENTEMVCRIEDDENFGSMAQIWVRLP